MRRARAHTAVEPDGGATAPRIGAWDRTAHPVAVTELRHAVDGVLRQAGAAPDLRERVTLATSEALTNAVTHAAVGRRGQVRVTVDGHPSSAVIVTVSDDGPGIDAARARPGLGRGLALIGTLADGLATGVGLDGQGTSVRMTFGALAPEAVVDELEPLCALATATVADAACLDRLGDGVLRRVGADVPGDPGLAAFLRDVVPPARPGTATWAAVQAGEPCLIVHDPAQARPPLGIGERLDLQWWLALPVGRPAAVAVWGFGGRRGGQRVPDAALVDELGERARAAASTPSEQARLRARLAERLNRAARRPVGQARG